MTTRERRENVRVTFRTTTILKFADQIYKECETTNVSVGGAFVNGIKGPKKGDQCEIILHLIGRTSNLSLEMVGEVVRVEDSGVGLQFIKIDDDSFYHMKNIVYFNFKNPEELGDDYQDYVSEDDDIYQGLLAEDELNVVLLDDDDYGASELDPDILDQVKSHRGDLLND
ncbi:MAG: PilZ domain-containing protein [Proteobacteria bacterium]|nr:PilZ domain-containing protein [Pseudomonadota bacterium]MBU1716439.1 PilZ domain-containing protein [Pseudomonadota bacterium]